MYEIALKNSMNSAHTVLRKPPPHHNAVVVNLFGE